MQALMIASQVMGAIGTFAQGQQAAQVGARNAQIMREQATANDSATYAREGLTRQRNASFMANQRASLSANGIDPASGSALVGVGQSAVDAEMDALTVRYEGLLQSRDMRIQADMTQWEGRAKRRQANFSAVTQLMAAGSGYLNQKQMPAPIESRIPTPNPFYTGPR